MDEFELEKKEKLIEKLKAKVDRLEKALKAIRKEKEKEKEGKKKAIVKSYVRKYEIDSDEIVLGDKIGGGGQAEVFHAKWIKGGGEVSVVVKKVKLFGNTMTRMTFFDLELFKVKEQLFHPSVVRIFGFYVPGIKKEDWNAKFPDDYGVVMERMDSDLLAFVKMKKLSILKKLVIMIKMTSSLCYLHSKGVIHRDIKCQNYLQKYNGDMIQISDLGIARSTSNEKVSTAGIEYSVTSMGGTWRWEAPEIHAWRNKTGGKESYYSSKVDMYALGCAFYEILFECKPFEYYQNHEKKGREAIIEAIYKKNLRPDISRADCLPEGLREVFEFCWKAIPQERMRSEYLLDFLNQLLKEYKKKYKRGYIMKEQGLKKNVTKK